MQARGIAVYPHLNEPDKKFDPDGPGVYQLQLSVGPEEGQALIDKIEEIRDEAYKEECKKAKKPKLKKADLPFTEEYDEDQNPTGNWLFRLKLKAATAKGLAQRPTLVDAKLQPMTEVIGSGSEVVVDFHPHPWFVAALGVGVTLRLRSVQVLELKEYSPSRVSFTAMEGFETAAVTFSEASEDTPSTDDADF